MNQPSELPAPNVSARWPELLFAAAQMLLAVLVITDSLRVGIGWADDGPRSGYFPFGIGSILLASSGFIFIRQLVRWHSARIVFAGHGQLKRVIAVLVPLTMYVAFIAIIGIYVASALLIGYFMWRHGSFNWAATALVSIGVPVMFFFVFERWFVVLLPKGPLERMLGF